MLLDLEEKTRVLVEDIVERSAIGRGAIFVLGLSSSEVAGGTIGKASSREIGQRIVKTILEVLEPKGIYLAVQGCEHLNRALVVERELAMAKDLEIVNVLPTLHAGGSGQLAAFDYMKDPVEVEEIVAQAGIAAFCRHGVEALNRVFVQGIFTLFDTRSPIVFLAYAWSTGDGAAVTHFAVGFKNSFTVYFGR